LAAEVLREDEPCWLVQAYSHDTERSGFGRSVVRGHEQLIELGEHMVREGNGEDCPWRFYGAPYTWNFHRHGQLWWDIADGLDGYVLMVSAKTGAVFAPYDGGVDLFLGGLDVAALRARYRDWLSPEPSGL
jgi:hypothetical protein